MDFIFLKVWDILCRNEPKIMSLIKYYLYISYLSPNYQFLQQWPPNIWSNFEQSSDVCFLWFSTNFEMLNCLTCELNLIEVAECSGCCVLLEWQDLYVWPQLFTLPNIVWWVGSQAGNQGPSAMLQSNVTYCFAPAFYYTSTNIRTALQ